MDNLRYDYDPIVTRKKLEWPNNARVALWVCPNIEYFHIDKPIRSLPVLRSRRSPHTRCEITVREWEFSE